MSKNNKFFKEFTKATIQIQEQNKWMCNTNNPIQFKMTMLKSSLCDSADTYMPVKRTITVANTGTTGTPNNSKKVILKNCAPVTDCTSEKRMHK